MVEIPTPELEAEIAAVFVYGTLMQGERLHEYIEPYATKVEGAWLTGHAMVCCGFFPAIIPSDKTLSIVTGEYIEVRHPREVLKTLDMIEGYRGESNHNHYNRRLVTITLSDGSSRRAWAYVYASNAGAREEIASGSWREFNRQVATAD